MKYMIQNSGKAYGFADKISGVLASPEIYMYKMPGEIRVYLVRARIFPTCSGFHYHFMLAITVVGS